MIAAGERFERSYADPESAVLPLDDPAKKTQLGIYTFRYFLMAIMLEITPTPMPVKI